jgi:carbamoylphosphate synthase large subunit
MKKLSAFFVKGAFCIAERIKCYAASGKRQKILFSRKIEWQSVIEMGFWFTPHSIIFAEFTSDSVANADLVVPLTVGDAKLLHRMRERLVKHPIPIPELHAIELCDDKLRLNEALSANGFADHIPATKLPLELPYIVKQRIDEWGENSYIVRDKAQEQVIGAFISSDDYFCQQLVPGQHEHAVHILIRDNEIVCALNIEYEFVATSYVQGRDRPVCKTITQCQHLELFADMLNSIGFEGLCCIDYKLLAGRPQVLEINPRFGGSLCMFFFSFLRHIDS